MAASFTAERKAGTGTSDASSHVAFSPATNCTTGSTLYLIICLDGNKTITGITDTKNTWAINLQPTSVSRNICIASSYQTVGLTTADTVTITTSTTSTIIAYWMEEFALDYSSTDVNANGNGVSSATMPTGTTAATANADEVAIVAYCASTATITKNASYTAFTTGAQAVNSGSGQAVYRILSATGTQNADGTNSSSMANSVNGIQTYKQITHARVPRSPAINIIDPALV